MEMANEDKKTWPFGTCTGSESELPQPERILGLLDHSWPDLATLLRQYEYTSPAACTVFVLSSHGGGKGPVSRILCGQTTF